MCRARPDTYDTGWGWGAKFFDYDNDGWLDLYVTNGWVSAGTESYVPDVFEMIIKPGIDLADARNWPPMGNKSLSGYQKKRLFHNERGQAFNDQAPQIRSRFDPRRPRHRDRGLRQRRARRSLRRQRERRAVSVSQHDAGRPGTGREFALRGDKSNALGVGAQVRVTAGGRTQLRFVDGGNGFAGQSTHAACISGWARRPPSTRWRCAGRQAKSRR